MGQDTGFTTEREAELTKDVLHFKNEAIRVQNRKNYYKERYYATENLKNAYIKLSLFLGLFLGFVILVLLGVNIYSLKKISQYNGKKDVWTQYDDSYQK